MQDNADQAYAILVIETEQWAWIFLQYAIFLK